MTTQERINRIIKESKLKNPLDLQILRLELESLVVQAQLEQLKK